MNFEFVTDTVKSAAKNPKSLIFVAIGGGLILALILKKNASTSVNNDTAPLSYTTSNDGSSGAIDTSSGVISSVTDLLNQNNEVIQQLLNQNQADLYSYIDVHEDQTKQEILGAKPSVTTTTDTNLAKLDEYPVDSVVTKETPVLNQAYTRDNNGNKVIVGYQNPTPTTPPQVVISSSPVSVIPATTPVTFENGISGILAPMLNTAENIIVNNATQTPDLGNNGKGYKSGSEAQLIKDNKGNQAEIDRVNKVIKDRESQGLDTSLQKKYLEKIS